VPNTAKIIIVPKLAKKLPCNYREKIEFIFVANNIASMLKLTSLQSLWFAVYNPV